MTSQTWHQLRAPDSPEAQPYHSWQSVPNHPLQDFQWLLHLQPSEVLNNLHGSSMVHSPRSLFLPISACTSFA